MNKPFEPGHPEQAAYDAKCSMWLTAATSDREKFAYRDGHHAGWNNAVASLGAAHADVLHLNGERAVLLGLLTDCAAVLRTIDPDDSDEAEKLADLLSAIDRAQGPDRHHGALL